jgi:hypothetical protein
VVTDSGKVHAALANQRPSAIYDELLGRQGDSRGFKPRKNDDKTNLVLQFVFMTKFDLDRVSPAEIAKLSQDREGLFSLKEAIKPLMREFPQSVGNTKRYELLKEASADHYAVTTVKALRYRDYLDRLAALRNYAAHESTISKKRALKASMISTGRRRSTQAPDP